MISNHDRSGWFGASDTDKIVGNWNTKSWLDWWLSKIGIKSNNFESVSMNAGTHKEHQILEYISPIMEMDRQIIIPDIRLRVNLDGNIADHIFEVKTHSADKPFKAPKKYIQQVIVQMYALNSIHAHIASYGLTEDDYKNYFLPIDKDRLKYSEVKYDKSWIENIYLPKITYLAECLINGVMPERE